LSVNPESITDLARGAGLGVALYSRIAVRVVNSNIVPFWSVGRAVKAIRTARLHLGHVPSQKALETICK
jgi:hypothetical protein